MPKSRSRQIDSILFKAEACYHNAQFDPNSIDVWHEALAEYDIADISAAFTVHVKQSRFLPTVAEIIQIIKGVKDPQISIEARALQQWRVVVSAVRKYGTNKPPQFTDPITANLVRKQFRWSYLCGIEESKENWEQKRWCEAYDLAAEIHKDLLTLDVPRQVRKLLDKAAKPIEKDTTPHFAVSKEAISEYRQKLKGQVVLNQAGREARIAELKALARQIQEEEI